MNPNICQKAGIQDLRIHDLRRTIPSWMAMTGENQYVIGKLLNEYMNKAVNSIIAIKT